MSPTTVAVLSMGGTISCAPSTGELSGIVPTLDPTADVQIEGIALRPVAWSLTDSAEITFDQLVALAHAIRGQAEDGVDGIVVTQGTDTLEETAYALSLLRPVDRPVVLTAAMKAPGTPGSDTRSNLLAAVTTAVHSDLGQQTSGAVVVMNDQIHSARWVHKAHTQRVDAFSSGIAGDLGFLAEGRVHYLRRDRAPALPPLLDTDSGAGVRVALLTSALDQDPDLVRAVLDLGYAGLVIEGLGGGHVNGATAEALGAVAAQIPVVFASRTRLGAVLTATYGSPGAELDLIRRGCLPSGTLDAIKARVLLTLLLRSGFERPQLADVFRNEGHG